MTTIIGFVPSSSLIVSFPIGFKEDGSQIDKSTQDWPSECRLIFLDDDQYATCLVPGKGSVLVVQHIGNERNWELQNATLEQWGWQPSRVDKFSRIKTFSFWRDVLDILSGESEKNKPDIIKSMEGRYLSVDRIQKLDAVCAWFILSIVEANDEKREKYEDKVGKILKSFSDEKEERVLYDKFVSSDIKGFLSQATNFANN